MEPGEVAEDEYSQREFSIDNNDQNLFSESYSNNNPETESLIEYIEPTYTIKPGTADTDDSDQEEVVVINKLKCLVGQFVSVNSIEEDVNRSELADNGDRLPSINEGESFLVCSQCNYKSKRKYMMKNHILSHHFGLRHQCHQCPHQAKSKDKLTAHVKRVHSLLKSKKAKMLVCDFCNFKTSRPYALKVHRQANHEGVRYKCKICNFSGKRKDLLNRHMKIKHPWELEVHESDSDSGKKKKSATYPSPKVFQSKLEPNMEENVESEISQNSSPQNPADFLEMDCVESAFAEIDVNTELMRESDIEKEYSAAKETLDWMSFAKVVTKTGKDVTISDISKGIRIDTNKLYFCNQCNFSDPSNSQVTRHKDREHNPGIQHLCDHCDFTTVYKEEIIKHRKTHKKEHNKTVHTGVKFQCDQCYYLAKSKQYLGLHIKSKHLGIRYECEKCDYKATTMGNLRIHEETHQDNIYQCQLCDYQSNRLYNYKSHVQTKHENKKFPCKLCAFEGNTKAVLRSHKLNEHSDKLNTCDQCDYHTAKKDLLKSHVDFVHEGMKYLCNQCEYSASRTSSLLKHLKFRHNVVLSDQELNKCAARQLKVVKPAQSIKELSTDIYFCVECEYKSSNKYDLKYHIAHIHQGKRRYTCPQCDYRTNRQTYIYSHVFSVHEGKRFTCDLCDFQTVQMDALHAHIRSLHNSQFPLKCDYEKCSFQTTREEYLLNHEQKKHNRAASKTVTLPVLGHEMTEDHSDSSVSGPAN